MRTNIPGLSSRRPVGGRGLGNTPRMAIVPVDGLTTLLTKFRLPTCGNPSSPSSPIRTGNSVTLPSTAAAPTAAERAGASTRSDAPRRGLGLVHVLLAAGPLGGRRLGRLVGRLGQPQRRLVHRDLADRLVELGLVRPGVDLEEQVVLADLAALPERGPEEVPGHPGLDPDR